jgi:hypothetical protein
MSICKWCKTPIRKMTGDEQKPNSLACWIHITGFFQCPDSRSEYDLATYDPKMSEERIEQHVAGAGI